MTPSKRARQAQVTLRLLREVSEVVEHAWDLTWEVWTYPKTRSTAQQRTTIARRIRRAQKLLDRALHRVMQMEVVR